jgi:hypothetical protein
VRRSIQAIFVLSMLCGLAGCFGPDYGPTYGYPTTGYSPYSYGLPVYARGYAPVFTVHHPWEEHHEQGHHESFYHGPAPAPRVAVRPTGRAGAPRGAGYSELHH